MGVWGAKPPRKCWGFGYPKNSVSPLENASKSENFRACGGLKIWKVPSNPPERCCIYYFTYGPNFWPPETPFLVLLHHRTRHSVKKNYIFHEKVKFLCFVEEKEVFLKAKTTISFFEKSKYTPGRQF